MPGVSWIRLIVVVDTLDLAAEEAALGVDLLFRILAPSNACLPFGANWTG